MTQIASLPGRTRRSTDHLLNSSISGVTLHFKNRSASKWPGATALPVILPRSSWASTGTIPSIPALEAIVGTVSRKGLGENDAEKESDDAPAIRNCCAA